MSHNMDCPYCGAAQKVSSDDGFGYTENIRHEAECRDCGKNFIFTTSIVYYCEPEKADCLNGGNHDLEMSRTYPRRYSKMCCKDCDFYRLPTEDEFLAAGISAEERG